MTDQKLETRVDKLEDRLLQVEWSVLDHTRVIEDLAKDGEKIGRELESIQKTLLQIKYFAMGVSALYAANSMGLADVLKLIGV